MNSIPNQLENVQAYPDFIKHFPYQLAKSNWVLALDTSTESGFKLATAEQSPEWVVEMIRRVFRVHPEILLAPKRHLENAIDAAYQNQSSRTQSTIADLESDSDILKITKAERQDLLDQQGTPPVIRLVNSILFDAAQEGASDIHIQPYEDRLQVRFRIDGVLFDQFKIPKSSQEEILSRIKIIGRMDIAEKRVPQDGRATAEIGSKNIDLRIASMPTSYGERIVIRLLDKSARLYTLDQLGLAQADFKIFQRLIQLEHGLILVTGPTGGGKSTTLYASLQQINTSTANVVTLEDPIEYQLDGISQTQISEKKGMTFAGGLRSILRQDPDIIMIGEIRDHETAELGIQSALTGHMVFSTLHTNDAPTAVTRLLDLKIEPFLVASSVIGVLSQRLVRKICSFCIRPANESEFSRATELGWDLNKAFVGEGCDRCRGTGYSGRVGVFELMVVSEEIKQLIQRRGTATEIRIAAEANGMKSLVHDGREKIEAAKTTIAEIVRIAME